MVKNSIPAMADAHISEILTAMGEAAFPNTFPIPPRTRRLFPWMPQRTYRV
jgi:hypothetical protein